MLPKTKKSPKIPSGMVDLMKDLTRNVLREQPENIYLFAAEYFENLIRERDGTLDKGYETFRQYEDDLKRRKNELAGFASFSAAGPSAPDATGMEVHGVAIKAKPRESKLAKLPMNRRNRSEMVKNESQESVSEDETKSASPPVVREIDTAVAEQKPQQQTKAIDIESVPDHKPRILSSKLSTQNLNAIQEETNAEICDTQTGIVQSVEAAQKVADELEQPETPTNDTSLSDALTEPTVIELDPIEEVNDVCDDEPKIIGDTKVVAASDDDDVERKTVVTEEMVQAINVAKLNVNPNIDRLQTPESDSGLSEKSFNLKVHENEEIAVNEDNTIGDEESLNFISEIEINKESAEHVETPEDDRKMQVDESESAQMSIKPEPEPEASVAEDSIAEENDNSSVVTADAVVEPNLKGVLKSSKSAENERDEIAVPTDTAIVLDRTADSSVEKSDNQKIIETEIEAKPETANDTTEYASKSLEEDNSNLENPEAAISPKTSVENSEDRKMEDRDELTDTLPGNNGIEAVNNDSPANAIVEDGNGEKAAVIDELSSEPWQSAMDKLSDKVEELDANQKRIVREIYHEAEHEKDAVEPHDQDKHLPSTEMQDESGFKSISDDNVAESKVEEKAKTGSSGSVDKNDKVVDTKGIEQELLEDNVKEAEASTTKNVPSGDDGKSKIETKIDGDSVESAETKIDLLAETLDSEKSQSVDNEQSEHGGNRVADVTSATDGKVEIAPETDEKENIESVDDAAGNGAKIVPTPNDLEDVVDVTDSAEVVNQNKEEIKIESEVGTPTDGAANLEQKSEDVPSPHDIKTGTDELTQADSQIESPKEVADSEKSIESINAKNETDVEHQINEVSGIVDKSIESDNAASTDAKSKEEEIIASQADARIADVSKTETNPIPENEEKLAEADNSALPLDENSSADVESDKKVSSDVNEVKEKEEEEKRKSMSIVTDEKNLDTQRGTEVSAEIVRNTRLSGPNTETMELADDMKNSGDHKSTDNSESTLPDGKIIDDTIIDTMESGLQTEKKASEEIVDSQKNVESTDDNLNASRGTEIEHEVIETKVEGVVSDKANDVTETDLEANDTGVEKFTNPIMAAMQRNDQLLNQMHSPRSNLQAGELAAEDSSTEKPEEIEKKATVESSVDVAVLTLTEAENPNANEIKETDLSHETIVAKNDIQPGEDIETADTEVKETKIETEASSSIFLENEKKHADDNQDREAVVSEALSEPPPTAVVAQSGEEFVNPIVAAMRNNEQFLNEIHSPRSIENDQSSAPAEVVKHSEIDGDGMSEVSTSNLDESFEHAETVIMGDESVKDLDLLAHDDAENEKIDSQSVEAAKELSNDQIEPDSLDMLADSLEVSLEPSMEPDSLIDNKSIDSLDVKANTAIVVIPDEAKTGAVNSIDDTMLSLNLSATVEESNPAVGNSMEKDLLQVPPTSKKPSDLAHKKLPMGDVVDDKNNYRNLNEQMRNQLAALDSVEQQSSIPIQIFNIEEVDSPLTPKPFEMNFGLPQSKVETFAFEETEKPIDQMVKEAAAEFIPLKSAESAEFMEMSRKSEREKGENQSEEIFASETKPESKVTDSAKAFSNSNDVASSDLSDTDTDKEKVVAKTICESGMDESSRDERDEVSEIENFDLSSCGEDSLEAMYYQIRKNEILVDKGKEKMPESSVAEDKIAFPGKATDNLEQAFREVSGRKMQQSMESSTDEVVVHQLSTDTDGMYLISGGENESETETSAYEHPTTAATVDSTDEELMDPISAARRRNEQLLNRMHSVAASTQDEEPELEQENDQFPSGYSIDVDDMNVGNIRRKIMASSMSEADSDYFEHLPSQTQTHRLTKDDFNISTAFEHMIRNDSTTDSESTIESAATKIQAGARGFLTRRRLRRSSASNSASAEKHSSIGNAAIDKSLDDLVENSTHELLEHRRQQLESDETVDDGSADDKMMIFGITDVKMEQRRPPPDDDVAIAYIIISGSQSEDEPKDETDAMRAQSGTAQRRLTLQRGDAMQRYSSPDESTAALVELGDPREVDAKEIAISNKSQQSNASRSDDRSLTRSLLGPRQRSMPVQIEMHFLRVLPKHKRKRVKSATSMDNNPKRK